MNLGEYDNEKSTHLQLICGWVDFRFIVIDAKQYQYEILLPVLFRMRYRH